MNSKVIIAELKRLLRLLEKEEIKVTVKQTDTFTVKKLLKE